MKRHESVTKRDTSRKRDAAWPPAGRDETVTHPFRGVTFVTLGYVTPGDGSE